MTGPKKTGQTIDFNRFKQQEKNVEEARKKKRKRISKETPGRQNRGGANNNRKPGQKPRNRPAAVAKVEPTEEEVQKQIRETLEKLQGKQISLKEQNTVVISEYNTVKKRKRN